ncbi:MAG TPA: hypothetical protein ENK31_10525 [Nannocystis exedens]|nr:hypothetical protein [Nannocystis exedens]
MFPLIAGEDLACKPGEASSQTNSETGTMGTESGTTGDDTETTGSETTTGPETTTTGPETTGTETTADLCAAEGSIGESVHECGCTINTCENGIWSACEDESPSWCGVSSMLYSVTFCASDSLDCGPVTESCAGEFCDVDPDAREYDEEALNCTLAALRDRTPGMYGWESTLDGSYSGEAGVFHLRKDGAMWARECDWEDLGTSMDQPSGLGIESAEYFEGCLAMAKAGDRWQCMRDGLSRTAEIPLCDGGIGGPPPLGTCADGGIAWAGSAVFQGSDPGALKLLAGVECIEGPLRIDGVLCPDILDTLGSLRRIDGSLTLKNLEVSDLMALSALTEVGGTVVLRELPQLLSLEGLGGVAAVHDQLSLIDLPKLTDLSGLGALTDVDKMVLRELGIVSLDGLGPSSPTSLEIWDCPELASIEGLGAMVSAESVRLVELPMLTSFEGLANLISVGFLEFSGVGATNLVGLDSLAQATTLGARGEWLVDIGPLPSLVTLGRLSVDYSPEVESLSGLTKITELPSGLSLSGLPALGDLAELSSVQEISYIDIRQCDGLADLTGLGAVSNVEKISLDRNASLESVVGLDSLLEISDWLVIRENPKLVDMAGMVLAPSVGGRVQFLKNAKLSSLAGMEGVTSIVGDLQIIENGVLTSLAGLANMTKIEGGLTITDNVQLPTQEALDFAAGIEVTGMTEIGGNG